MSGFGSIPMWPFENNIIAKMTEADVRVYACICAHARRTTWRSNPSVETIARETGMTDRAVRRALRRLEAGGLVLVAVGGGRKHTNLYTVVRNPVPEDSVSGGETRTVQAGNPDPTDQKPGPCKPETLTPGSAEHHRTAVEQQLEQQTASPSGSRGRKGNLTLVTWDAVSIRFTVDPGLLATWKRDYPHLDVDLEIRKAAQHHATKGDWRNFRAALVRWLNRATGGSHGQASASPGPTSIDQFASAGSRDPTPEDLDTFRAGATGGGQ